MADIHRITQLRSLEYHRAVAERLDDALVALAQERAASWAHSGARHAPLARRWLALLDGPRSALVTKMTEPSEDAAWLRSATPFAGALPPRERWALWRRVREEVEAP